MATAGAMTWHGDQFFRRIVAVSGENLEAGARYYAGKLREAVSVANTPRVRLRSGGYVGLSPSRPGEPPRKLSGDYRRKIAVEMASDRRSARVGTNDPRSKWFEVTGTRSRTIVAGPGKAIPIYVGNRAIKAAPGRSLKFKSGDFIFRKRVRIRGMRPRPHFVPVLQRHFPAIARIAAVQRQVG